MSSVNPITGRDVTKSRLAADIDPFLLPTIADQQVIQGVGTTATAQDLKLATKAIDNTVIPNDADVLTYENASGKVKFKPISVTGITESAEQTLAFPTTAGASNTLAANRFYFDAMTITNPNAYKYIRITAIEIQNGATVAGNVVLAAFRLDVASPPSSANIEFIAATPVTAQAGANSAQKINVAWSIPIAGTPVIGIGVFMDSGVSTFSVKTPLANQNRFKAFTFPSTLPPFDTTAWTAGTDNIADMKLYYKGYS